MRSLLIALLFVPPIGLCHAQSATAKLVEPTVIGVIYSVDSSSRELKRLPNEPWKEKPGKRSVADRYVEVNGEVSSFRIKSDPKVEFVFSTGSPEKVALYRFDQKKNQRVFEFQKRESLFSAAVTPLRGLNADVSKFGESSYKLVPGSPLTPGEYAIVIAGQLYTFGVDQ